MVNFFKNLWTNYQIWKETRAIDREVEEAFNNHRFTVGVEFHQDQNQRQLTEALIHIKNKVKNLSEGDLKSYLDSNPELTTLAQKEPDSVIEILRQITVASGQDVKTEDDKVKMIDQRIKHYYELQKYNEEKELTRKIRLAMKSGNKVLHDELMKEWRKKYGIPNS